VSRQRILAVTGIAALVAIALDVVIGYSPFPGYGALIGFAGTVAIVVVSGWLTSLLARPEGYYPDETPPDVEVDLRGTPPAPTTQEGHDG
jgi:hypothetical protein